MTSVDDKIKEKMFSAIEQIVNNLTDEEYKSYFENYLTAILKKTANLVNEQFLYSVIGSMEEIFKTDDNEFKLAAVMLMLSLVSRLRDKKVTEYSELASLIEEKLCPRLYDMFTFFRNELVQYHEAIGDEGNRRVAYEIRIRKLTILAIVVLMEELKDVFHGNKRVSKTFSKLYTEMRDHDDIDELGKEFSYVNFDIVECSSDLFTKEVSKSMKEIDVKQLHSCLHALESQRAELYSYLTSDPTEESAKILDEMIRDYVNVTNKLQDILIANKNAQFDDNIYANVKKELNFANFVYKDAQEIAKQHDLTFEDIIQVLLDKYEEIFYEQTDQDKLKSMRRIDEKDKTMEIPEIKTPREEEQAGMRTPRAQDENGKRRETGEKPANKYSYSKDNMDNQPVNTSKSINETSNRNVTARVLDEPAKAQTFNNIFENQKRLDNKRDVSNLSVEKEEHQSQGRRNKSRMDEEERQPSFERQPDAFKAAFENAGKLDAKAKQDLNFKKSKNDDFRFRTEESVEKGGPGFDFKDFGNFDDFNKDQTHNSVKNFSDFGNFNDGSRRNISGFGNKSASKNSGHAVQKQTTLISANKKTPAKENNSGVIPLDTELKFGNGAQNSSKPTFNDMFARQEPIRNSSTTLNPLTTSFTTQIKDRFKRANVNGSPIEKKSTSSFIGAGSVNINFGASRFNSKNDNMTSSRISTISNTNRQLLKNAMTRNTPTLLTMNHTTVGSTIKPKMPEQRPTTALKAEPVKRIAAPPVIVHKASQDEAPKAQPDKQKDKPLVESQINQPKENEPAFNFDDFHSINNESQTEEVSVNTMSNIIPASFKYNASKTSKADHHASENQFLHGNAEQNMEGRKQGKTLSVRSNAIKPNENLITPFDNQNKSMQGETSGPFTPKNNLEDMKAKYNDIMEKHQKELLDLHTKNRNNNSRVQNDNSVIQEQVRKKNAEYDKFFEQMKNDYEALIDGFKSAYVEQQRENQELYTINEELRNKVFQLENDLATQVDLKNIITQSLNEKMNQNQKSFDALREQLKTNYENNLKKTEADYKEKISRLNKEIERLTMDGNDKVNKYLIENNALKLELANALTDDQTKLYDVKKQIEDLRLEVRKLNNEFSGKIKSYAEQTKALSPKFQELIALRNKLMNESLISKSEITFYDKKAKELKEKLERIEQENQLLKSKTMRSSQVISTNNLMNLKSAVVNMKTEFTKLKEQVDQDSQAYKDRISHLKQLKATKTVLETKVFNLEIQNNSRIGQINRLSFQFESMKEENEYLKQRVSELLEQKKNLQSQILEITKEPTNFIQSTANDMEMPKKLRELEYEVRSLNEINKEITEENITMKERLIKLEASNNSDKLRRTLRQMEAENEDLYQRNKSLLNELYEVKSSSQTVEKLKERLRLFEKENNQLKAINNQLSLKSANKNNEGLTLYNSQKGSDNYGNLRGTAFIKKYDMYLDMLNNKKSQIKNKTFLDLLETQDNKEEFARKCIVNNYCLFRDGGFKIYVEEKVIHRTNNIDLVLKLTFSNLVTNPSHIMNFKIVCAGTDDKRYATSPFNVELNGMEVAKREVRVVFEESYLISGVPLIAEFCMLENYKMKKFLTGEENSILDDNMHCVLFPIAINKLLIYQKAESNLFSVIKSLNNVGSLSLRNLTNIDKDDIYNIFPQLEIIGNNKYGVKILSIYGNFLLTLEVSALMDYKIDLYSMYENPIHEIYLSRKISKEAKIDRHLVTTHERYLITKDS